MICLNGARKPLVCGLGLRRFRWGQQSATECAAPPATRPDADSTATSSDWPPATGHLKTELADVTREGTQLPTSTKAWTTPVLSHVVNIERAEARAKRQAGPPRPPTYDELVQPPGTWVALKSDPDTFYEWEKEKHAAEFLRRVLGIHLRSVWTDHGTTRRPDSVWDEERLTVELKAPESDRPSRWGELVADGADKADVVVFVSRNFGQLSLNEVSAIVSRSLGAHGREGKADHVLVIGHTDGTDWHYWAKGGPA